VLSLGLQTGDLTVSRDELERRRNTKSNLDSEQRRKPRPSSRVPGAQINAITVRHTPRHRQRAHVPCASERTLSVPHAAEGSRLSNAGWVNVDAVLVKVWMCICCAQPSNPSSASDPVRGKQEKGAMSLRAAAPAPTKHPSAPQIACTVKFTPRPARWSSGSAARTCRRCPRWPRERKQ